MFYSFLADYHKRMWYWWLGRCLNLSIFTQYNKLGCTRGSARKELWEGESPSYNKLINTYWRQQGNSTWRAAAHTFAFLSWSFQIVLGAKKLFYDFPSFFAGDVNPKWDYANSRQNFEVCLKVLFSFWATYRVKIDWMTNRNSKQ